MSRARTGIGRAAGLVALVAVVAAFTGCGGHSAAPARPGPGCAQVDPSVTCSVLFIGNSYTAVNDLPTMFTRLAASGRITVSTGALDPGGTTLADHLAASDTAAALNGSTWNVVVLQDQSEVPAVESYRQSEMYPAARALVGEIRHVRAEPVFFETWAHSQGWPEGGLIGYDQMQAAIDQGYQTIAHELGAPAAPVGDAWSRELGRPTRPGLWDADGSHPTTSGTYLAACVMYATIFRRTPLGLGYHADLPQEEASELQRTAADVVLTRPTSG